MTDNQQSGTQHAALGTLMSVFAHPDDETFGCAGTMAKYAAAGTRVIVVCATRGEVGEISDLSDATPETLGHAREGELRCAAAAFGASEVIFLDYIDGQVANADFDELTAKVALAYRQYQPDVVLTFGPEGAYGHPDHVTIHKAALAAWGAAADPEYAPDAQNGTVQPYRVPRLYYSAIPRNLWPQMFQQATAYGVPPVGWLDPNNQQRPGGNAAPEGAEFGTAEENITTAIDITNFAQQKYNAIHCHASQLPKDFPMRYLPVNFIAEVMNRETYSRANPDGTITPTNGQDEWTSEL